jgi:acyl transferase domain-containing protein/acyl carrier protein
LSASVEQIAEALRISAKENERLRQLNRSLREAASEPIAIVGMSCRYPGGVVSPAGLWDLVVAGRDAISEFPEDREWDLERLFDPDPGSEGTSYVRHGGFVDSATEFDPGFFGIGPREALAMDPQGRLLLEGSWEALEDGGIDPEHLRGSDTGVFAGVMYHDYGWGHQPTAEQLGHFAGGGGGSIASGRVAYALGLEGPAITIDTACSSSLVSIHLAAQALRRGECSLALAGGATVLSTPGIFVYFSHQRGLAPDGRCKSFADAADGTAVSEGVGLLVLERLSDANRNGHRVLATIRGSAVNQDGASNGLTAPNGPSQERVIRQALDHAGLAPGDIEAVEAHGTGTTLGDPIEAGALLATYGQERDVPLKLGSIKSNIGHSQAAAGVAGVIKMTLALRVGVLPRTLHLDAPSSKVDWDAGKVALLAEPGEWSPGGGPRRAAVSSFGLSGTNAHLVLEEAPAPPARPTDRPAAEPPFVGATLVPLSAKSGPALLAQASRLAARLEADRELTPPDLAHALATTRPKLERRAVAVAVAGEREQLRDSLTALGRGEEAPDIALGRAGGVESPVFLFPGQGSQWRRMGVELARCSPVFKRQLDRCEEALSPFVDWSLRQVLGEGEGAPSLERLDVVQPALFAVMVSLAELWRACGVRPSAVVGHSQGEIAAACVSGGLSLEDAARLVALRSQILTGIGGKGSMVSVALSAEEAERRIEPWRGQVELAARNGPEATILSARGGALEELLARLDSEGVRAREILAGSAPSHSAMVEPLREELLEALAPLGPREGEVPFHSTVTGAALDTRELGPEYWYRNMREPVRFEEVVRGLLARNRRVFVEVSPHPVFAIAVEETVAAELDDPAAATVLGTLRREEGGPERFGLSLATAQAAGVELDWERLLADPGDRPVDLPTYPFQRKRYWLSPSAAAGDVSVAGLEDAGHPFLAARVDDPAGDGVAFSGRISLRTHPWLADHAAFGSVLLPGTALVELAIAAGGELGCGTLEELVLEAPFLLPEDDPIAVRVSLGPADGEGRREVAIHSRPAAGGRPEAPSPAWSRHASGIVTTTAPLPDEHLPSWPPPGAEALEVGAVYERLAEQELDYGPAFQGLTAAWRRGEELFAEVSLGEEQAREAGGFNLHPALLDAAGHASIDLALEEVEQGQLLLPFAWRDVSLRPKTGASSLRLRLLPDGQGVGLTAYDMAGEVVASIGSVVMRPLERGGLQARAGGAHEGLYRISWPELAEEAEEAGLRLASLGGTSLDLCADSHPDLGTLLDAAAGGAPLPRVVLADLRAAAAGNPLERTRAMLRQVLELTQAWVSEERLADARLAVLTEGAAAVGPDAVPDPAVAALWGFLRSVGSEHPGRLSAIDLDGEADEATLRRALAAGGREPQLAIRDGRLLTPRLSEATPAEESGARPIDPDSTVLITGGCSGVGALVARHLVHEHGARHLLLLSRSGPARAGAGELAAELEQSGCEVAIEACDVSDRERLAELIEAIPAAHPLGTVIHSAGVLADGTIESMDGERIERVLAPKAEGAWHLHQLTAGLELDRFVLFSSAAGILGGAAQANYAAANAFLDALAAQRRALGLPGASLAWGSWGQASNLAGDFDPAQLSRALGQIRERLGVAPMVPERGLELFDAAAELADPLLVPAPFDHGVLRAQAAAATLPAVLRGLVRTPARGAAAGSLARRLAAAPEAERGELLVELVRGHAAAVLGHDGAGDVEPDRAFKDLGFDSLGAVELRNRLAAASGLRLPPTVVFDHPSALALARFLRAELEGAEKGTAAAPRRAAPAAEPIAIVGMACRYPGGIDSPRALWRALAAGEDTISPFPEDRGWDLDRLYDPEPGRADTFYSREGGFLVDAADFDPGFFGISPREALAMDPQERILLEVAWEALEDGGIDPQSLHGGDAGVFAGVMYQDYGPAPGLTSGSASGRISYTLGLEGPAISVDTACSSSLVAIHLAAQSLRGGECSLALAGGVAVAATPSMFLLFSQQRGLAADGRCKAFAEAADGTGISEGAGVVLLERLSDAHRNGHPVLATIRGSAINQDGASNGITAPSGPSQERVIRAALAAAGLAPADVDAVEAHGTGTMLGDPIEAGALIATYGQERQRPLRLGSLKSNIGHAQAAAGVGGVIKAVMAMRERTLPRTLHVDAPSSKVDWEAGKVELLREPVAWEAEDRPRRAGVSSFGASGTNAHLVLEEEAAGDEAAPEADSPPAVDRGEDGPALLPLSAKSPAALASLAARLRAHLAERIDLEPADVGYSLASTRAALEHRAVLVARDREEVTAALAALERGEEGPALVRGRARRNGRLAYLFSGQGSQRAGMGRELYERYPAFAEAFDAACEQLDVHLGISLRELVFSADGEADERLRDTANAQPALFALQVGLFRLLEAFGLRPGLLAGHSIGELTAAHLAGVFALDDAARLVAARGRLMAALPPGGAMLAVEAEEREVVEAIAGQEDLLSLAAVNGPRAAVLSGEEGAIAAQEERWRAAGRKTKRLSVSHAFHSPLIDPILDELDAVAREIAYSEPLVPIVSDLTGSLLSAEQATDPTYWVAHARQPVRFADAVATLRGKGATTFVELGPEAVLSAMARECLEEGQGDDGSEAAVFAPCMRAKQAEADGLAMALARLHAAGQPIEWEPLFSPARPRRVPLPTYPFQRQRYWLDSGPASASGPLVSGQLATGHPLLGAKVPLATGGGVLLTGRASRHTQRWLADHSVGGTALLPGTALLELALRAGREVGAEVVEELVAQAPLVLPRDGAVQLQVSVGEADAEGRRELAIHSRPEARDGEEEAVWTPHARGSLGAAGGPISGSLESWPPPDAEPLELDGLYDRLADSGIEYGPAFRAVRAAWRAGEDLFVELALPREQAEQADRFVLHPALFDAVGHVGVDLALAEDPAPGELALPFAWHGVRVGATGAAGLRARISGDGGLLACDGAGAPVAAVESLSTRPLDAAALGAALGARLPMHRVEWEEPGAGPGAPPSRLALLGELAGEDLAAERHPDLDALLEAVGAGAAAPELVLAPLGEGEGTATTAASVRADLGRALELLRGALADPRLSSSRLCILTRSAVAAGEDGAVANLGHAAAWGMVRSAQAEHPGRFGVIDIDGDPASLRRLRVALPALEAEPQLALRGGRLLAPRLARSDADPVECPLDPDKTVLISGGTGGLGGLLALHLARQHGLRHLLLASRSGADAEGAAGLLDELARHGAEATVVACDLADREQVGMLLAAVPVERPLGAVVHAAGTVEDGLLQSLDRERLDRVLAPKVDAVLHLHELTAGIELSHFVLFSSAAGVLGTPGQANYAAANAFLDAFAVQRRAAGLPATSLAWGAWELETGISGGMGEADIARLGRIGLKALSAEQGLRLLDAALGRAEPALVPAAFDRGALRGQAAAGTLAPILGRLAGAAPGARPRQLLAERLAAVPVPERRRLVLDLVRDHVAAALGHPSGAQVEVEAAFSDLGFDSLAAVELRNGLSAATGMRIQPTLVFDYPSTAEVADHLLSEVEGLLGNEAAANGRARKGSAAAADSHEDDGATELAAMSHGEMFDLIDEEFGTR